MDILNRMSVIRLMEKKEKVLPIDDIRHCPKGLRILDGAGKEASRASGPKKYTKKNNYTVKKIIVFRYGMHVISEPVTISEAARVLYIPINTISCTLQRNRTGKQGTTRDGYSFEIVSEKVRGK
ncbi:hypothetical protein [Oceanispirochaeta sp.]|jgi:hypothetical protein|uniref:hypothetical protein n=1 Tax=Oceanispirochaeta sp. TaxID=2035350 RepID=UPI0026079113|nr:hypothetical protein [Oceanispirochaeta sp.]MDA3957337.1 hypothetical protein [Oceanispirochaeta sp.]